MRVVANDPRDTFNPTTAVNHQALLNGHLSGRGGKYVRREGRRDNWPCKSRLEAQSRRRLPPRRRTSVHYGSNMRTTSACRSRRQSITVAGSVGRSVTNAPLLGAAPSHQLPLANCPNMASPIARRFPVLFIYTLISAFAFARSEGRTLQSARYVP